MYSCHILTLFPGLAQIELGVDVKVCLFLLIAGTLNHQLSFILLPRGAEDKRITCFITCYVILFSVRNINFNNNLVNLTNVKLVFKKYTLVEDPRSFYN